MCLVSCDGFVFVYCVSLFVFVYCVSLNVQYGPGSCQRLEGRLAHCKNPVRTSYPTGPMGD